MWRKRTTHLQRKAGFNTLMEQLSTHSLHRNLPSTLVLRRLEERRKEMELMIRNVQRQEEENEKALRKREEDVKERYKHIAAQRDSLALEAKKLVSKLLIDFYVTIVVRARDPLEERHVREKRTSGADKRHIAVQRDSLAVEAKKLVREGLSRTLRPTFTAVCVKLGT